MSIRENLDEMVVGPTLELAAKVKALLDTPEGAEDATTLVKTSYGNFYVSAVVLSYYYGGDSETVGYLVPDEGEGNTFDFYTHKDNN